MIERVRQDIEKVIYDLQLAELVAKDHADDMRAKGSRTDRGHLMASSLAGTIGVAVDDLQLVLKRLDREDA